jgi:hypothetical protein
VEELRGDLRRSDRMNVAGARSMGSVAFLNVVRVASVLLKASSLPLRRTRKKDYAFCEIFFLELHALVRY